MDANQTHRGAFLASRLSIKDLREKAHRLGESLGRPIWVSELVAPELNTLPLAEVQIACLKNVSSHKQFICVLDGTYAEPWNPSQISILELELFMAALSQRQITIFLLKPFNEDPRLSSLLKILRMTSPNCVNETPMSSDHILSSIARLVDSPSERGAQDLISHKSMLGRITRFLARFRSPKLTPQFSELDVQFLNKTFAPFNSKTVDKEYLNELIRVAAQEQIIPNKLAHLWTVVRHLSQFPYTESRYKEYIGLWDKTLSHWASAAAWYRLHGHLFLGRLAAVNTLRPFRSDLSLPPHNSDSSTLEIQDTCGAIASEYYSIAKSVDTLSDRYLLMNKALWNVNQALNQKINDRSGLLLIRGSIYLNLARPLKALQDFDDAVSERVALDEKPGRIGEAQTKLGLAYFYLGNVWKAQTIMEAAVEKLESSTRDHFTIQALENLGFFYKRTLRPKRAMEVLARARSLAAKTEFPRQL
jgi:tetratricopeptide (TPR) repeat protein